MKYAIAVEGDYTLLFFYKNINGFIATTRIVPTTFPNKKKAKRVLKRLNKHHGKDWFILNYQELISKKSSKAVSGKE